MFFHIFDMKMFFLLHELFHDSVVIVKCEIFCRKIYKNMVFHLYEAFHEFFCGAIA